jgi:cellulose synthase/poly-beta-1,6-N-acetylglucosamine synthase-like glycosyltransferase
MVLGLFWVCLAASCYIYAGSLLFLKLVAVFFGRPSNKDDDHLPTVTMLIPAYNEAGVITAKVENALALDYPPESIEFFVISDGSTDDTERRARLLEGPNVRVFHYAQREGKNVALNKTIPYAVGRILLFSDANTMYSRDAVRKLVRGFRDPRVGGVVGKVVFSTSTGDRTEGSLYWKYENYVKKLQSAVGSVLVANGAIFAVRRELFSDLAPDVANDFQQPIEIAARGYSVVFEPEAVATEVTPTDYHEEFHRKVRIILRGLTGAARLRGQIRGFRRYLFIVHKLLRWFTGYILVLLLLTNLLLAGERWAYGVLLGIQALFYAAALTGWLLAWACNKHPGMLAVPFYICMVSLAGMVASWSFLRGRTVSIWQQAESTRQK